MSPSGISVKLEQAGKRYNRDWIFKKLDLELHTGDFISIAGANGAGKSTLLQCLMGYQSLSTGTLWYQMDGRKLSADACFEQMSLVSPYLELPEGYTLQELIDFHFGLKAHDPRMHLAEMLEDCKLSAHLHKQLWHFSSGMKQRAKLLLGFGAATPLLFLDEPTTNLDQKGFEWFDALMERATQFDKIIVIASNQAHETQRCNKQLQLADYK